MCEFNELRNSLIKDALIIGLRDKKLQEILLRENDINLEKVLTNCRASEASKQQTKSISSSTSLNVPSSNSIDHVEKIYNKNNRKKEIIKSCKFCSGSHYRGAITVNPKDISPNVAQRNLKVTRTITIDTHRKRKLIL